MAVWRNPCSTFTAKSIASSTLLMRTSGSTGISCSVQTSGCSAVHLHQQYPRLGRHLDARRPRDVLPASLPTKSLFGALSCPARCPCPARSCVTASICAPGAARRRRCASSPPSADRRCPPPRALPSRRCTPRCCRSRHRPRCRGPAFTRSAVWSTTQGGLPGPAQMAFFPLAIAAFTTPGPPVTTRIDTPRCFISSPALSMVGSGHRAQAGCCGPPARYDRLVQEHHQAIGHALGVGVHVEDHRVARRDHADGVAGDRGKRDWSPG